MGSPVKILLLLIRLRSKDKGNTHGKEIKTSKNPYCFSLTVSSLTQVKMRPDNFQGHVPFFCDKNWNAPLDPPVPDVPCASTYAQWKDGKALFVRIAFASYAFLLTLNQGLFKSMDAPKTKFQGKVFSAALRKGVVRLWTVKKEEWVLL